MPTPSVSTPDEDLEADDELHAAINPYRLAELVADRPINWRNVPDEDAVFIQLLGLPRAELFSLRRGSPVFAGLEAAPGAILASRSVLDYEFARRLEAQGLVSIEELGFPRVRIDPREIARLFHKFAFEVLEEYWTEDEGASE